MLNSLLLENRDISVLTVIFITAATIEFTLLHSNQNTFDVACYLSIVMAGFFYGIRTSV